MSKLTRRDFTKIATAASVSTALGSGRVLGANDRIRLGFIAIGNRGDQVLDAFLAHKDAEVVAVCDIHQPYTDFASKKIGGSPQQFKGYRKLLEMKDVDAVVINTPDHWHALQMIHACQAGKDVYVEKPLSLTVVEGRRMVEAAERHKRVVQVGLQRRSSDFCREAVEFIRSGGIGKVTAVRAFHIQNEWPKGIGKPPDEAPPADFDWEAWLGPAPKVPYNKNRTFYRFRWFYDYSGGQLTNMGVHYLDLIQWALGQDAPAAVTAMGGNFAVEDNRDIPDTLGVNTTQPIQTGFSQTTPITPTLDNGQTYIATLQNPFPNGLIAPQGVAGGLLTNIGQGLTFFNPDMLHPYSQRFSLGLQRELPWGFVIDAGYVGNRGTRVVAASGSKLSCAPRSSTPGTRRTSTTRTPRRPAPPSARSPARRATRAVDSSRSS